MRWLITPHPPQAVLVATRSRFGSDNSPSCHSTPSRRCATLLAEARSRRGSDSPPGYHSIPRRRFATKRARLTKWRPFCAKISFVKAPSGRELPTKEGEGECVTIKLLSKLSLADSFRHGFAMTPSSRRKAHCHPVVYLSHVILDQGK